MVQATVPLTDETTDGESFGEIDMMGPLGFASMPYPATDLGHAEGIVQRNIAGSTGVCTNGRDTRTASIVGNMKPGDTVVHSTGPQQAAQLQLKEEKRQAVLVTKTTDGKTAVITLDGLNDKCTIALLGYVVEVSAANGINLTDKTGAVGLQIKDGTGSLWGPWTYGGRNPIGFLLYSATPVVGVSGLAAPLPGGFAGV